MMKAAQVLEGMSSAWPDLLRSLCEGEVLPSSSNTFDAALRELAQLIRSEDADLCDEITQGVE
jgi:hypothetical protein